MAQAIGAIAVLAQVLAFGGLIQAQENTPNDPLSKEVLPIEALPPAIQKEETVQNPVAPCLQPPPLISFDDYRGPFQKVVGTFARKLDRKSVHIPHYKPGAVLCSLELKDKFMLFVGDTRDPFSFLSAAFNAGLDQASNQDPTFGQGMLGYTKRFAADFAGDTTGRFLMDFAYPTIFGEDPRYYRLGYGRPRTRLFHALEHTFVAHRDSGTRMFNFTEWLGTTTAVVINNSYHPGNERGFGPTARAVGFSIGIDMGYDVLREFWPEIARKFKMPFRDPESETAKR
jgi:hypothetical protein